MIALVRAFAVAAALAIFCLEARSAPTLPDPSPAPPKTAILPALDANPEESRRQLRRVCDHVYVDLDENQLNLGDVEKRLACGDKTNDSIGRPWSNVPPAQAGFFLRSFFQSRGRHQPQITYAGDDVFVRGGAESHLTSFRTTDVPQEMELPRKREVKGRLLAPKFLDELETWGTGELKHQGYACGGSKAEADPATGETRLRLVPGERKRLLSVEDAKSTGLGKFVLDRYDAFQIGEWYDQRLVDLTRRRILDEGFLDAITFSPTCDPDGARLERDAELGASRQVRLGVGATSELGPRVRASFRYLRLDEKASQAEATADASLRIQTVKGNVKWRYSDKFTRSYLEPSARFEHDLEDTYETQTTAFRVGHAWTFEFDSGSMTLSLGPNWQETFQTKGVGPPRESYFFGDGYASWQSHDYEYFKTSPREGTQADLRGLATDKLWGAGFTAQQISTTGEWLTSVSNFDPPLFILAARWRFGTTFVSGESSPASLPLPFRFFAGGIQDLRGFARQGLPGNDFGALTVASGGLEGRFYRAIFRAADPFVFLDVGKLGPQNASLETPTYVSPGAGVRYESPFGAFRVFVAQGIVVDPRSDRPGTERQWRANVTYGEEF